MSKSRIVLLPSPAPQDDAVFSHLPTSYFKSLQERLYEAHCPPSQSPAKATKETITTLSDVTRPYRQAGMAIASARQGTHPEQEAQTQKTIECRDYPLQTCGDASLRLLRHCRIFTSCSQQPLSRWERCAHQGSLSCDLSPLLQPTGHSRLPR